ncbi:drug/metabolite transporter (DMT)-like permease [Evansella vedderi]|uniref:Drug/metabolite transporter (DMT)-like permease n=1 Tax=Evansella vedderi TaxID=38282 RepID=A0ABT9ZX99_9BACI|nr:DMT family transporter [Evansella vedderi]MDQ0255857.1 drug/metabolite transporter (DMT)-like permease [Evansella vedderi]
MNAKAFSMALITIIIWGSAFAAIRASLQGGYDAGHLVLVRYLIASAIFVLFAFCPGIKFRLPRKGDVIRIIMLGWIGISVYHIGVTFGMKTISAGTAGMLIGAAPIFTAIIAVMILKERLSTVGWLGLGIGFSGIICIKLGAAGPNLDFSVGTFFVLISALATSFFFVFQKQLLARYTALELTAYLTWAGTIPFFIFTPGLSTSLQNASMEAHLSALFVGIFPAAIAYVTWAIALSAGKASSVTSMMYLEPAIAVIVAWIWLSEWPTTLSLIGGLIALSGVIIINVLGKNTQNETREVA